MERKKVIQLLNGKPIAIYNSIGCAARAVKVQYNRMQDVLHGRRTGTKDINGDLPQKKKLPNMENFM